MANFTRQHDILHPESLIYPVNCIGVGGIGSNTAFYLRKMGFSNFTLWDPDQVESVNVPSQHFSRNHIGIRKVEAMAMQIEDAMDEKCVVNCRHKKFIKNDTFAGIVIAGVDSMTSRDEIWNGVQNSKGMVPLYIDGRIGVEWDEDEGKVTGEFIEVFTIIPARIEDAELYEAHLFPEEDSAPLRCTAQAVAYIGAFVAGFICANVRKWIMKQPYHRYILYDCLTNQVLVATH